MSTITTNKKTETLSGNTHDFLTLFIGDQIFGIPILQVQDVLGPQPVTQVPLAPPAIAGSLNLRGRIVTAINVRACLAMPIKNDDPATMMSVVIEHESELYSLLIDKIGDVLSLSYSDFEKNPATLQEEWRGVCQGIYRLQDRLLVVLDVPRLLESLEPK